MLTPQQFLKSLVDETRFRCLMLLLIEGEMCVCELSQAVDAIQPKISRNLALLRQHNVVTSRRNGQWIFYALHPELPQWAKEMLHASHRGCQEQSLLEQDIKRLATMDRPPKFSSALSAVA
ncbi:transcriptional regulator, ArsR family [Magnetococcus marinus MC-1]|uniref:Transcriptional regulator, ArsR family n=1 Tax=Magnetococcus marinus (strain ATCC BAA-1437 / JCM 17883 / MC-1) TaxID=156889 RepID=A0LBW7_MAGMM|nr:metalloregulator ArsR/SmtB family transcription factor [Magnetococcus marinus]ABK45460.1 transcriptional regulator, ArsR family [Magnetococcus marinus MC-1]